MTGDSNAPQPLFFADGVWLPGPGILTADDTILLHPLLPRHRILLLREPTSSDSFPTILSKLKTHIQECGLSYTCPPNVQDSQGSSYISMPFLFFADVPPGTLPNDCPDFVSVHRFLSRQPDVIALRFENDFLYYVNQNLSCHPLPLWFTELAGAGASVEDPGEIFDYHSGFVTFVSQTYYAIPMVDRIARWANDQNLYLEENLDRLRCEWLRRAWLHSLTQ
ncbi:hypothetical protein E4U55_007558 [Claviceps digitariae]|nr:hypothetical protein E4U55_007558 [Claviceps digitariae]